MTRTFSDKEGWAQPWRANAWHYFREGRSLCKKWAYGGRMEIGNDGSPDNCKTCAKKVMAEKATRNSDGNQGTA